MVDQMGRLFVLFEQKKSEKGDIGEKVYRVIESACL